MDIPKGTIGTIVRSTNQMYWRHLRTLIRLSWPFWIWTMTIYFLYVNNGLLIHWLNQIFLMGFFIVDSVIILSIPVMFGTALTATVMSFEAMERNQGLPPLRRHYRTAFGLLWPLIWLKIRFLFRAFLKALLLILPGVLAFADGVAYYMAFLYDHKRGGEAIAFSDQVVRVNRFRYWDFLLVGLLIPSLVVIPWVILMDQVAYVSRLDHLSSLNLLADFLKFVGIYFGLIYVLIFHYRIYVTFKSFLPKS